MNAKGFIPPHGNYRELLSYQKAEVVYDITFRFCHKFLAKGDRTIDQMIQAARSGKQNIFRGLGSLRHFQGDGNQAHQRRPRQPWKNC